MAESRTKLLADIKAFYEQGLSLIEAKNHDYSSDEDPWRNFRFASLVGVTPERAILVRISDKLARIANLLDKEAMVDEKVEDTLLDCANYIALLYALLKK